MPKFAREQKQRYAPSRNGETKRNGKKEKKQPNVKTYSTTLSIYCYPINILKETPLRDV